MKYQAVLLSLGLGLLTGCMDSIDSSQNEAVTTTIAPSGQAPAVDPRPSFLIILSDDMGYTDLGAFGGDDIATPNLDALAFEGVRLTNFHAAPSCQPTRSMLMSGNGNHEAGVGSQTAYPEHEGEWGYEYRLADRIAAMPEILQNAGYDTFMTGKWHLNEGDENLPAARGFDRAFTLLEGGDGHLVSAFETEPAWSLDGERIFKPEGYSTDLFVDYMIQFMEESHADGTPFLAYFAPTAPHWPIQAHPDWMDAYAGVYDEGFDLLCTQRMQRAAELGVLPETADVENCAQRELPWPELDEETRRAYARRMEIYAAMTGQLDVRIGDLLEYMDSRGMLDNTYIIYMNDNGPQGGSGGARTMGDWTAADVDNSYEAIGTPASWGNHGLGWADATSSPFREGKSHQYEGGIRVPAFVWHSNIEVSGSIDDDRLFIMDVLPTLLDLSGTAAPEGTFLGREIIPMRGKSFASRLSGNADSVHGDNPVVFDSADKRVVFIGDYKAVKEPGFDWELYNVQDDPGELQDLAEAMPDKLSELQDAYFAQAELSNYIPLRPAAPGGGMGAN